MEQFILALDAGTTSNRAILFNRAGEPVNVSQKEFTQYYPNAGWVEHDPMEIWSTMLGVSVECMQRAGVKAEQIAGIGITNQRETTIVWDRNTGTPVYPAIVWQCRRTAEMCDSLMPHKELIREKTGLILDPYFSATKVAWILSNVPGARERAEAGELLFGTVETWLIWKLTGGRLHITDYSNASRTMLFNIHTLDWDEEILKLLSIPRTMLPDVRSNSEVYGKTDAALFGAPIKLSGAAGDQQSALFGQKCFRAGEGKNTYGTGCFLLMNTGEKPVSSGRGLVTTIAWCVDNRVTYALEGSVFVGGAAIQWLRDELGLIRSAQESEELALRVNDTNGCYVVPAFTGLGAPYWNPYARGTIVGLTRGVNACHIVRATLDGIAYQVGDVLAAMAEEVGEIQALYVDGGASSNNYLMQTQADISGISVIRPACVETTALGAAFLAGLAVGFYPDMDTLRKSDCEKQCFLPKLSEKERAERLRGWKQAIAQTDITR